MLEKKYLAMTIMQFDSLPEHAYLLPLLHHKMGRIDNVYDPKKIIFNKESLERCERSYLKKIIKTIYEFNYGSRKEEKITF